MQLVKNNLVQLARFMALKETRDNHHFCDPKLILQKIIFPMVLTLGGQQLFWVSPGLDLCSLSHYSCCRSSYNVCLAISTIDQPNKTWPQRCYLFSWSLHELWPHQIIRNYILHNDMTTIQRSKVRSCKWCVWKVVSRWQPEEFKFINL